MNLDIKVSGCPEGFTIVVNGRVMAWGLMPCAYPSDIADAVRKYQEEVQDERKH